MPTFGAPWQGPRWAALVSLLVAVAIGAFIWWLLAESVLSPPGTALPTAATQAGGSRKIMHAMNDANVVELTFRIACFYQARKRLPESFDELRQSGIPDGSAPPATTAAGQPLRYERKGDRTYVLTCTYTAADTGQAEDVAMAEQAPAEMPAMDSEALRVWWSIEHEKQTTREMLRGLGAPNS
jgi:hypothetical protein